MRILLVDDHVMLLTALRQSLKRAIPDALIQDAQTGRAALHFITQEPWDVVLLDINLPDRDGLDLLHDIKLAAPKLPVLMLSGQLETEYGLRALQAGAVGYVSKTGSLDELVDAIHKACACKPHLSPQLADQLAQSIHGKGDRLPHVSLSPREFQILRFIAEGKSVGDIAAHLSLSVKTISTYRTRLLKKMAMSSNAELIRYALQHGLSH
jgi:two-component system, NarL family, invasion response regulator UvrY